MADAVHRDDPAVLHEKFYCKIHVHVNINSDVDSRALSSEAFMGLTSRIPPICLWDKRRG